MRGKGIEWGMKERVKDGEEKERRRGKGGRERGKSEQKRGDGSADRLDAD